MSTRCQTLITIDGEPAACIYRHCDGYPEGMGNDICKALQKTSDAGKFAAMLLSAWTFDCELEQIGAEHDDAEYVYTVDFPGWRQLSRQVSVRIQCHGIQGDDVLFHGSPADARPYILRTAFAGK